MIYITEILSNTKTIFKLYHKPFNVENQGTAVSRRRKIADTQAYVSISKLSTKPEIGFYVVCLNTTVVIYYFILFKILNSSACYQCNKLRNKKEVRSLCAELYCVS